MNYVPYVVEQTSRGERSYDIFSRLLNDRIIKEVFSKMKLFRFPKGNNKIDTMLKKIAE